MPTLIALARLLIQPAQARPSPVRQLLEEAGARFGRSPRQAAELQEAASAYLRVLR